MSLSKSHATLDYLDTFMSISWRREYIKQNKSKKKQQQRSQNKTQMSVCVEKWMEIDNYVML